MLSIILALLSLSSLTLAEPFYFSTKPGVSLLFSSTAPNLTHIIPANWHNATDSDCLRDTTLYAQLVIDPSSEAYKTRGDLVAVAGWYDPYKPGSDSVKPKMEKVGEDKWFFEMHTGKSPTPGLK